MNRHLFAITKTLCTKSVFTFIFLLSITGAKSQPGFEKGLPFITNYTSKIYNGGPASWSVIQDDNGIMYFGNINPSSSILKYDGVHWNKIPAVVNSVITRCFEKDKNGVIYYGGYTDFGYLFSDSTGKTAEYSLLKYIPKNKRGFTDIWTLQIAGNDIYFQARERLFRLTKTTDNKWIVKTWEPSTHFMYTFYMDGVLYVHEQAKGLLKMVNDTLILIPGSEFLGKERMQVMLPYRGKMTVSNASNAPQYLIGTFSHGLYIFDGKNFKPFATSADSFFKKSFLYKALQIGGDYALSIPGHGVVFINPQGKITQIIDKKAGLQSDVISDFFEDKNGNLWMALDNGIAKANLNSPFTQYNSTSGISASPFDMARLPDGSLYIGTNNGLLRYDSVTNKFVLFDQIPLNQIFNTIADGNTLLVSGNGLDMIKDGKVLVVRPSINDSLKIGQIALSKKYPDLLYVGTTFGLALFTRDQHIPTGWQYRGYLHDIDGEIKTFAETDDGREWGGAQNGILFRITPFFDKDGQLDMSKTNVEKFGQKQGMKGTTSVIFSLNHRIYFLSDSSTFTYNETKKSFEPASLFGMHFFSGVEDKQGKLWLTKGNIENLSSTLIIATPESPGKYKLDSTTLLPLSDANVLFPYFDKNNIVWFLTSDGLIQYDPTIKANYDQPYKTLISGITSQNKPLDPFENTAGTTPEIKFKNNALRFEYAAPFYQSEDKTEYQTWLEGYEKTWSDWGKNTYKEYTNLSPGKYTFHVRAKNVYHKISEEAVYSFTILAPWYRTWWAYLLYAIVFLLVGFLILRSRTAKLKKQHRELEIAIKERTAELSDRVKELAVINNVQEGLVSKLNIQSIYDLVGDKIRDAFDAQAVIIGSFDEVNKSESFNYLIEKGKRYYSETHRPIDKLRKQLIETKQKIVIHNKMESFEWFGNTSIGETEPIQSGVFVPLIINGNVKRYVSLQNVDRENAFSDSDIKLLETLANSMSVALENARLFDETTRLLKETEQRTAELSVINSVQEGLAKELHIQAIYELVGNKLSEVLHTLDIDIRLFSPETGQVFFPYVRDQGKLITVAPSKLVGMSKYVYETHQTLIINEKLAERMQELGSFSLPGTQAEKSFMAVPIMVANKATGMVAISNYEKENAFTDSEVRLLQTVVSAMSVALENARLFDETNRLLKETEQKTAELAVINSVQDGLVREMKMQSIYELVGNRICELFDTQTVLIRTFNHNTGNEEWQFVVEKGVRFHSEPRPFIWANQLLIENRQPILINQNYLEFAAKHGSAGVTKGLPPKSALFVPMIVGDQVRGSVSLQNVEKENAFSDTDVRLLATLTNSMSVALENARLFDETNHLLANAKQRASELTTVNNISKALATKLNPGELINLVGDQLRDLFKANIVYLALLNKKNNIIYFPYQYGDNMSPLKLGEGLTSKIIQTGEPLLFNKDVVTHTDNLGLQRVGIPAASYLGVPIPLGDEIIGVLSVQSTEQENRFDENDLRLLSTIASSVGVSLRNAQLFEDVELAKMEAEKASKIAEKANEAKSAFLSTVSHELRTPLTSVLGFAKIINKRLNDKIFPAVDQSDPKTEKTVNQINENLQVVISEGERLTHLINDVLDLAKIEAGRMEWNQEDVSLAEVAERAILATTSLFDQKKIELVKMVGNNLPNVIGDPDKLIQVVINLFSNAVKFTEKGAVTCKVFEKNDEVIVSVSDTGIGIAKEDYGVVFEQFKQVGGDTLTDKPKGTGLGLPICKEIVEHLGGRIWVESEVGKGSTFSFALPFIPSENSMQKKHKPIHLDELVKQLKEQVGFSQLKMNGNTSKILVVDDDDSIRSLLEQELSEGGYLIEQATNGKQALECIRKNRPDLIILDVMMPEMNGFDVAAILKNDPQTMDIPIIILSIVQDKARGFRIGVDRYLTKPIDTAQLFHEVGNLLEQGKSKKKVMVVDEDSEAVRSLTDVLKTKGYQVVESDGKELVKNAIDSQPDIIILNSIFSGKQEIVKTLRFEKGLENVLFFIYQ